MQSIIKLLCSPSMVSMSRLFVGSSSSKMCGALIVVNGIQVN